jgi:hypothetical protein
MGDETLASLAAGRFLSLFSKADIVNQLNVSSLKHIVVISPHRTFVGFDSS